MVRKKYVKPVIYPTLHILIGPKVTDKPLKYMTYIRVSCLKFGTKIFKVMKGRNQKKIVI